MGRLFKYGQYMKKKSITMLNNVKAILVFLNCLGGGGLLLFYKTGYSLLSL